MNTPRCLVPALIGLSLHLAASADEALKRRELKVDGVVREELLHAPPEAKEKPSPVVFAFHGHGGNMNNAARMYGYHTLWPEAIVVYPQGLNTPGRLTDREGKKPGWQGAAGDQGDRDLKFFDAMLSDLRANFKVDNRRIYSTGHSNGGGFTYLLWAARGDTFAAFAPSAAAASRSLGLLKPKPVLHVAGENDPLVKFTWQRATIEALKKLNQCGEGRPWEKDSNCTFYPSRINAPVITAIHPGAHGFPSQAPALIVAFFKGHPAPCGANPRQERGRDEGPRLEARVP